MMKRIIPLFVVLLSMGMFGSTVWFLYQKSKPVPAPVETSTPTFTNIVKRVIAAGALEPRKLIELKPKVAGIVRTVYVKPGQKVNKGDAIAEVQIIPDVLSLNEAELRLGSTKVELVRLKNEMRRVRNLVRDGYAPATDLEKVRASYQVTQEELRAAQMRKTIVREGSSGQRREAATTVQSTVAGTVLSVPVREGTSVIQANSFNPGTTIASVADMTDMVFKGAVDESEVGKLREGMPVRIVIGALGNKKFTGKLTHVAPASNGKEGRTEFDVEAAFRPTNDVVLRAGLGANAEIVLEEKQNVLSIGEGELIFENDHRFVEVQVAPGRFEKRAVELGISDGIRVQVLSGIKAQDVLKVPMPVIKERS